MPHPAFVQSIAPRFATFRGHVTRATSSTSSGFKGRSLSSRRVSVPQPSVHQPAPRQKPLCYAENDDPDGDDDGDDFEDPDVLIWDPKTDRYLPAGIQHSIAFNGVDYLVCFPTDDPVAIAQVGREDILDVVEDEDLVRKLFPIASAVLEEHNMQLQDTPFVLTLSDFSDISDEDEDDIDDPMHEDVDPHERSYFVNQDGSDDSDVEVLAEFSSDNQKYCVVRPFEAIVLIAKLDESTQKCTIVGDEEFEMIAPIVEEFIMKHDESEVSNTQ